MRRALVAVFALAACSAPGPSVNDAGSTPLDAGATAELSPFNVYPEVATLLPGGVGRAVIFFNQHPGGVWNLTLKDVSGGTVTLLSDTLSDAAPRAHARVDLPEGAGPEGIRFTVVAAQGSRSVELAAQVNTGSVANAVAPEFVLYATPQPELTPELARYDLKVMSVGGFTGTVHLLAAGVPRGGRFIPGAVVLATPGAVATAVLELERAPGLPLSPSIIGVSDFTWKRQELAWELPPNAFAGPVVFVPPARVAADDAGVDLAPRLFPAPANDAVPTVELAAPVAGLSLAGRVLRVDASVPPGLHEVPLVVSNASARLETTLRLTVQSPALAGWSAVSGGFAGPCEALGLFANGSPLVVQGASSRCESTSGAWARVQDAPAVVRTLTRGTVRVTSRANQTTPQTKEVRFVDLNPSSFGTRQWNVLDPGDLPVAPSVALGLNGDAFVAYLDSYGRLSVQSNVFGSRVFPALDGLPTGGASAVRVAGAGGPVYLALADQNGAVSLYLWNRQLLRWGAPTPTPAVLAKPLRLLELDLDDAGAPVLAWLGADAAVHVTRPGIASEATFPLTPGTLGLQLALLADQPGKLAVAWREATHGPVPGATFPAPNSKSAAQVRVGDVGAWTSFSLTAEFEQAPVSNLALAPDAQGRVHLAITEGGSTRVMRLP